MKQISNKRTLADVVYDGEKVSLKGRVEIDSGTGKVRSASGDIILMEDATYIGNFSMLGINLNDLKYVEQRTEASLLIDSMVNDIDNGIIEEDNR